MLDCTGSSHQDGVLLCELGLGCGTSLNWEDTLLTREFSAAAPLPSVRPNRDFPAMCCLQRSWSGGEKDKKDSRGILFIFKEQLQATHKINH